MQRGSLTIQTGGASSFAGLGGVPADNAALSHALDAKVAKAGDAMTGALTVNAGTLNTAGLTLSQTWDDAGAACRGIELAVTDTNSAAGSTVARVSVGGTTVLRVGKTGDISSDGGSYSTWLIGAESGNRQLRLRAGGGGNITFSDAATVQVFAPLWVRTASPVGVPRNGAFAFGDGDNDYAGSAGAIVCSGAGSPEGVKTAPPGSLYLNQSGGPPYYKNTGTGNTGWVLMS